MPRHVIVQPHSILFGRTERPAHQQLCLRERQDPWSDILFPDFLLWHALDSFLIVYMPLAPVTKAAKLHIGNQPVCPEMRTERFYRLRVAGNQLRIVIIRCEALSVLTIVPGARFSGLLIQPFGNIHMTLLPRNVTDKSQDEMLSLLLPARKLIFLLD